MSSSTLSQTYFDEIVVENEEVFDLSPEEAVVETIDQLFKQQPSSSTGLSSLKHWKVQQRQLGLSLTHPDSKRGQLDRQEQSSFLKLVRAPQGKWNEDHVQKVLEFLYKDKANAAVAATVVSNPDDDDDDQEKIPPILLGHLFWRQGGAVADDDNENQGTTTSPCSGTNNNVWTKLCTFLSTTTSPNSSASSFRLVCQLALASLETCGNSYNKLQRRNRQEQILLQFCIPSHGWDKLFGADATTIQKDNASSSSRSVIREAQRLWLQLIHAVCQGHEPNKKYCNTKSILQTLVTVLNQTKDCLKQQQQEEEEEALVEATCRVVTVLCRFDDFSSQATKGQATDSTGMVVSSAHSTVTALGNLGIVSTLHALLLAILPEKKTNTTTTRQQSQELQSSVLLSILQALRSLAIQDEIVVKMVSTGLLDVLQSIFQKYCSSTADGITEVEVQMTTSTEKEYDSVEELRLSILTALIGLYRNMSANDELKSTLCRSPQQSILGPLIASLQSFTSSTNNKASSKVSSSAATLTKLQEHACATMGSMALRQPHNAQLIVQEYQGHLVIIKAMQMSHHSPLVQRQGALALRNLASRATPDVQQSILDAGAEIILRQAATLGAVDESYAALRDLGCHAVLLHSNPETGELERQPMFGEKPLQFRPFYD